MYAVFPRGATAVIDCVTRHEGRAALLLEWCGREVGWGKGACCGLAGVFWFCWGVGVVALLLHMLCEGKGCWDAMCSKLRRAASRVSVKMAK